MERRIYKVNLHINGRKLDRVVIDPHYEIRHSRSITDEKILALVEQLNNKFFRPTNIDEDGFQYFVNDKLELDNKLYKLIWLLHESEVYIGIVNAYRR